jgi:NADPH2:quinone reductase
MALPDSMACIELKTFGPPEHLALGARPLPVPGAGEVLIEVAAAGINRADLLQRMGNYHPPPGASDILGLEVAGTVVARGGGIKDLSLGDDVCALITGGGYAGYAVAAAALCLPVPKGLSFVQAAALPEAFYTVWHNLFQRGRLALGESALVHGGASGIGTAAIQVAKLLGSRVFVTARGADRCKACVALGAERAIDYETEDFVKVINAATEGRGVDVVLDMVGGDYFPRNLACLAVDGRHVSIATQRGSHTALDLRLVMGKRFTVTGSALRTRTVAEKATIAQGLRERVWPLLDSGRVRPVIHATFPLARAAEAHRLMEAGGHFGKIVLTV